MDSDLLPTSTDSLIFPSASHNFSQTLSSLKRSRLSLNNRLLSIYEDSLFVQRVANTIGLPLVANERCGSWYIPPDKNAGSVYFKSTDGHQGQWKFSLRRLNLQILDVIEQHAGCIIVDSTRSGKSMPDALAKTIPIWCSVINRLLFPENVASHTLRAPPEVVGRSEHSQIEERLPSFLENLEVLNLDIEKLRSKIGKPLRPQWVTQASPTVSLPTVLEFHSVICCTASRQERSGDVLSDGYIQGAGDDSESWSRGLTPALFWHNSSFLLSTPLDEEDDVAAFLQGSGIDKIKDLSPSQTTSIYPGNTAKWPIYICSLNDLAVAKTTDFDGIITSDMVVANITPSKGLENKLKPLFLYLDCRTGKQGSRTLREQLPRIKPFIEEVTPRGQPPRLLFACASGRDLSVGVALAVLCLYFNDDGTFHPHPNTSPMTKDYIRQRLSWIVTSKHDANPLRATLQSVNAFLMERKPS